MPTAVLPDAEAIVVAWLKAHAAVIALVSTRTSTELPSSPVLPLLTVSRIGGVPKVWQRLDIARLQVEAHAATKGSASSVARTARSALHDMPGYSTAGGFVTAVEDDLGLTWQPDPDITPPRPRYLFGVGIYIRPS